jgi:hypothetical protein
LQAKVESGRAIVGWEGKIGEASESCHHTDRKSVMSTLFMEWSIKFMVLLLNWFSLKPPFNKVALLGPAAKQFLSKKGEPVDGWESVRKEFEVFRSHPTKPALGRNVQ